MSQQRYTLGTIEASEQLINDLYIDLRNRVNLWSTITQQTPQARMGYIGQHLVSIVTGFPGGKSGARGYDLVLSPTEHAEIKTCYRVDQLGACKNCGGIVSSIETICTKCGSSNITRKEDSKWLIGIRNYNDFKNILLPKYYYFVLFEFEELNNINNNNIIASIWQVNPKTKGFAYCMIDYYLNIRAASTSKAPFNMWPYHIKFYLTCPQLIYKSRITVDNKIETLVFPTLNNTYFDVLPALNIFSKSKTLTKEALDISINQLNARLVTQDKTKPQLIKILQTLREQNNIPNDQLCNTLASAIYLNLILPKKDKIPEAIKQSYSELQ